MFVFCLVVIHLLVAELCQITTMSCRRYLPPEFVTMQIVSKEFDIYSLGIIILEMMAGISAHSLLHDMISEEFIKFVRKKVKFRICTI